MLECRLWVAVEGLGLPDSGSPLRFRIEREPETLQRRFRV